MASDIPDWRFVSGCGYVGECSRKHEDSFFLLASLPLDPITKTSSASYREDKSKVIFS
jgi:hypothetical protein